MSKKRLPLSKADSSRKCQRTIHHLGGRRFMVSGRIIELLSKAK